MKLIPDDSLLDPCYDIILAAHNTRRFSSRAPNKDNPTKLHLAVQKYLLMLYNGNFPHHQSGKPDQFKALIGNWQNIKDCFIDSIPTDRVVTVDMATFFWNENTNKSQFAIYSNTKVFDKPEVTVREKKVLKQRELPLDVSRCSSIMCPRYEECVRAVKPHGARYVCTSFLFDDTGCGHFEERETPRVGTRKDMP
jgi:hypothetical protein